MKSVDNSSKYTLALIISLLVLRIPILCVISLLSVTLPIWLFPVYELFTYLITAILIIVERNNLGLYHIDTWTVFLFMISRTLLFIGENDVYGIISGIGSWIIVILLFWLLRIYKVRIPARKFKDWIWIPVSILPCALLALFMIYFGSDTLSTPPLSLSVLNLYLLAFLFGIGRAPVSEEPLFRGSMGYLRKKGVNEGKILLIESVFFWVAHINNINRLSFWTILPVSAILFGLLVWKSRSVAVCMLAHAAYNAISVFYE